ncbi:MAG: drug/metabolite transporter (DMT)-like permease [Paracoccaceae bacterium]|jgi:drug/metabolite transporter (DMT)-like permease
MQVNTILSNGASRLRNTTIYGPVAPMRLILLTCLVMIAFAANSVLNRLAVDSGAIDPRSFAVIRVVAGALMLTLLTLARRQPLPLFARARIVGAGALTLYMVGFSTAYLTVDAGLGALILFGVVQVTMFAVSALSGTPATARQITGAGIAFGGLVWVLWPGGAVVVDSTGAALMAAAGVGWAFYTLAGRHEPDALSATAANFLYAVPLTLAAALVAGGPWQAAPTGVALAVVSGTVTSGLGYALWYSVLPRLAPSLAATVQLSVPVIALGGGVVLLGEAVNARLIIGGALVIGGIALSVWARAAR